MRVIHPPAFRWCALLSSRPALQDDVVGLLARLVTYRGRLPQGPPTSAAVLDRVLLPLDNALADLAASDGATYSRYADDLSFSSNLSLQALRHRATKLVRQRGYILQGKKTRSTGPGSMHVVTGIVVGSELHALPSYIAAVRHDIGRFRRGRSCNERSLRGQITWVARLNENEARQLEVQFIEAQKVRALRRARKSAIEAPPSVVEYAENSEYLRSIGEAWVDYDAF